MKDLTTVLEVSEMLNFQEKLVTTLESLTQRLKSSEEENDTLQTQLNESMKTCEKQQQQIIALTGQIDQLVKQNSTLMKQTQKLKELNG